MRLIGASSRWCIQPATFDLEFKSTVGWKSANFSLFQPSAVVKIKMAAKITPAL